MYICICLEIEKFLFILKDQDFLMFFLMFEEMEMMDG